jgi:ankyrin repeat protein
VLGGQLDAIAWLLDHGADINKKSGHGGPTGATPLHFAAAWRGQLEAAKLLVARGADLGIRDDNNDALASGWANHFKHKDIEAFLLKAAEAKRP